MKKTIAFVLCLIAVWALFPHWPDRQRPPEWPDNQKDIVYTLSGEVALLEDDLLAVRSEKGELYFFEPSQLPLPSGTAPRTGDRVTLRYTGRLQKESTVQKVKLLSMEVLSPPPAAPPTPPPFPPAWEDKGIFSTWYPKAYAKLKTMTLAEKAGQVFLARCPETGQLQTIENYHPGGFILFARDFAGKTRQEVVDLIASCQSRASVPMLMAVDEEGGKVIRVSQNPNLAPSPFLSPQALWRQGGMSAVYQDAEEKARLLMSLGLNVNVAPVCDVSTDPNNYMYSRAFGQPAKETASYVSAVVRAMEGQNFSSVLKHFPGYGQSGDTHTGVAVDGRPYETFEKEDFLPFIAGIEAGAPAVLAAHTVVSSMDDTLPASLSPLVHRILRDKLSFTGVIMTDDLAMEAVAEYVKTGPVAVAALKAGNDLLIVTDLAGSYGALLGALQNGSLSEEILDRAVFRVLAWKYQKGILK